MTTSVGVWRRSACAEPPALDVRGDNPEASWSAGLPALDVRGVNPEPPWSVGPPALDVRGVDPSTGFSGAWLACRVLVPVALEGESDQTVDQVGVAEPGGLPHLRVATGRR